MMSNAAKNFDILAISLSFRQNYFDASTTFSNTHPVKFLIFQQIRPFHVRLLRYLNVTIKVLALYVIIDLSD